MFKFLRKNSLFSFFKLFKKQLLWILLGGLLSLLAVIAGLALLSLSGWFISTTAYVGGITVLAWQFNYFLPSSGVRFFSLLRIVSRYGERVVSHQATFKILTDVRIWFYQKLEPLAPAHLMQYQSGDLLARMVGDVDALDNLYLRVLVPMSVVILATIIALCFFACFSLTIAWIVFFSVLMSAFFVPVITGLLARNTAKQLSLHQAKLKNYIINGIQGLTVIKIFHQEHHFISTLSEQSQYFYRLQKKMHIFSGATSGLLTFLIGITVLGVVWVAVGLVNHHQLNGANIALLALGVIALLEVVKPLPSAYQHLGQTHASAERILQVVNQEPTIVFPTEKSVTINRFDIAFDRVQFSYSNRNFLFDNFNLQIVQGEKLAIVGHTGAGKSTLMQLLARFWDVSAGSIKIGGADLRQLTEAQLRNTVHFVSQQPHIFNTSIRENLLIANEAANEDQLRGVLARAELGSLLDSLPEGLDSWVGEHGQHLSGGQQKRLALARIFLTNAPIVILDEPTEGLDRATEENVFTQLLEYAREKTMILITHNEYLLQHMDRVVRL